MEKLPAAAPAPVADPVPVAVPSPRTPPARGRPSEATRRPSPATAGSEEPGTLRIQVEPWGDVALDGKAIGQTPLAPISVAAGWHVVRVRHATHGVRVVRVRVAPGESRLVRVDFSSGGAPP